MECILFFCNHHLLDLAFCLISDELTLIAGCFCSSTCFKESEQRAVIHHYWEVWFILSRARAILLDVLPDEQNYQLKQNYSKQTLSDMVVNNKVNYCKSIKPYNKFTLFFIVLEVVLQGKLLKQEKQCDLFDIITREIHNITYQSVFENLLIRGSNLIRCFKGRPTVIFARTKK